MPLPVGKPRPRKPPTQRRPVLVVCDNELSIVALRSICAEGEEFAVCGAVGTLAKAEPACTALAPEGLILDVAVLPARDGGKALAALARHLQRPRAVVLFLSDPGRGDGKTYPFDPALTAWSAATARDPAREWHAALEAAFRGALYVSPGVLRWRGTTIGVSSDSAAAGNGFNTLSPREEEVLALTHTGLMPQEIARRLGRSVKTIEAHYARIKAKLGIDGIANLRGGAPSTG